MLYVWVKAFHVVAVITWIAGMLVVASVLVALPSLQLQGSDRQRAAHVVRAWDRAVTTPAMLLVWALGLTLALRGHWFAAATAGRPSAGWLPAKLVFVLALSALHGMQAGALRRLAGGAAPPAARARRVAPALILGMVAAIVVLVIVKPF